MLWEQQGLAKERDTIICYCLHVMIGSLATVVMGGIIGSMTKMKMYDN